MRSTGPSARSGARPPGERAVKTSSSPGGRVGDQLPQHRQAGGVGVGNVVDQQDGRLRRGQPGDPLDQQPGGHLGQLGRGQVRRRAGGRLGEAEHRAQQGHRLLVHAHPVDEMVLEQGRAERRRVVGPDAGGLRQQRAEHPVGAGGLELRAGAFQHGRLPRCGLGGHRRSQAGLPDPPAADEGDRRPLTVLDRAPRPLETLALARPPDQGRPPAAADPALRLPLLRHLVHRHRGAVREDDVLAGLDLEAVADQPQHLAAHDHGPRPGRLVELGGQVRGVPEGEGRVVPDGGDQHLAGVRGDAHRQRLAGLGLEPGRQAAQHDQQVEAGPNGPGRVVLARHRVAEPHVDPVALVLCDPTAVAFHNRRARIVVGAEDGEVGLDVPLARQVRRPDHVAEHDGEEPTLAGLVRAPFVGSLGRHGVPHGRGRPFPA